MLCDGEPFLGGAFRVAPGRAEDVRRVAGDLGPVTVLPAVVFFLLDILGRKGPTQLCVLTQRQGNKKELMALFVCLCMCTCQKGKHLRRQRGR